MLIGLITNASAIPSPRKVLNLSQPDGSKVIGRMVGDEFFHYALSEDNYILLPDKNGFYTYAVSDSSGNLAPGKIIAKSLKSRSQDDSQFLKTISPNMSFSKDQQNSGIEKRIGRAILKNSRKNENRLRSTEETTDTYQTNDYPTTGTVKSVVILVNFSDVKFTTANAGTYFSDMQNKTGFNKGKHIGSVRDYYFFNSGEKFRPEFVVIGPVTLDNPMSYYGANDENGEDVHPAIMVMDACIKAASLVNFSQFDSDSNGYVDNVYVYYAGMGESDGGGAQTIWPHSWALSGESLTLTLNGKKIEDYACSSELQGDETISGIGTFAHEYGHILGLPDLYDSDYEVNGQSFDLGEWSIMAYGAYNANGAVPPALTIIERQLLDWITPMEINDVSLSLTLPPIDSSNIGYIIKTSNSGEYFLLENRQKRTGSWDEYILYHGLLIYHIDMRSNATTTIMYNKDEYTWTFNQLWYNNVINAISTHQCVDIEEADNLATILKGPNYAIYYQSVKGDPFPGSYNRKSFTDETTPSMKTWNGTSLDKPLTDITETDGNILFDFRGGSDFGIPPLALPAQNIEPYRFTATWSRVDNATGYYLDVFRMEPGENREMTKTYIAGYENLLVKDSFQIVDVSLDLTTYHYQVRATNGYQTTENSGEIVLTTPDGKPDIKPASGIGPFKFTANWNSFSWATGYYIDVYKVEITLTGDSVKTFVEGYENLFLTDSLLIISELDDQTIYQYRVRATNGVTTSRNSDFAELITPDATEIIAYVKDRTIYLKGIDHDSQIRLYDLARLIRETSETNILKVYSPGIYFAEVLINGQRKVIKLLVK